MDRRLPLGQALGLFTAALLALGTAGCRVARPDAYPLGLYSVGSETNLAEISRAGFNLVTGPAKRGLDRPANRRAVVRHGNLPGEWTAALDQALAKPLLVRVEYLPQQQLSANGDEFALHTRPTSIGARRG